MEINVSVRQLVEFILREGDIDNRKSGGSDTAMLEGGRIHREIQKSMGSEYHSEVPLKFIWKTQNYDIIIEGRADGIIDYNWGEHKVPANSDENSETLPSIMDDKRVIIDEIKGTYKKLKKIHKPAGVHLAQAKCYAYIYAEKNRLDNIGVRMTYCNIESKELKYFHFDYTFKQLEKWFDELLAEYRKWTDFQFEWNKVRTDSIKSLNFPFPYREGQKELVSHVYRTIYHGRKLFIEAPTGVGKTISTVFPAVKSMGEQLAEKIFYLTAKTITRTVAQNCFSLLNENGLKMKTVIITAKDKICFLKQDGDEKKEVECNPDACPYAKGHLDRVNDAMYDMLTNEDHFTRETVMEYARKYSVCPFEFCLDMSLFSDVVICDYNYVFDPRVYLKRFFGDTLTRNDYVFLIDEAHNLLDRGREMYSAALFKGAFLELKNLIKDDSPRIAGHLDRCNKALLDMKRKCDGYREEVSIDIFVENLKRAYAEIDDFLDDNDTYKNKNELLEFYFDVCHFLNMYEIMDGNYVVYSRMMDDGDFMLKLFCVDPAKNLGTCMAKGRSTILFSATLLPIQYYKKLLGGTKDDYEVYAKSTFNEDKKALLIANDVTSKYTRRTEQEYRKIAKYIYEIVIQRYGNYMVFLPSHTFLEKVYGCFKEEYFDGNIMECVVQESYMNESAREDFLLRFQGNEECDINCRIDFEIELEDDKILIGFCVMGGIFSEGIDLKNDSLIGAIIVGTGLPQVGCERELLKNYFDKKGESGFDYSYRYPGINKVLQSAGRVIRTADDIGVVALLDERFLSAQYLRMFPREWSTYEMVNVDTVARKTERFWDEALYKKY